MTTYKTLKEDERRTIERIKVRIAETRQTELLEIIRDLTDLDDCWLDHHGYCQAHGWFETEPKCPHARAKELLAQ